MSLYVPKYDCFCFTVDFLVHSEILVQFVFCWVKICLEELQFPQALGHDVDFLFPKGILMFSCIPNSCQQGLFVQLGVVNSL